LHDSVIHSLVNKQSDACGCYGASREWSYSHFVRLWLLALVELVLPPKYPQGRHLNSFDHTSTFVLLPHPSHSRSRYVPTEPSLPSISRRRNRLGESRRHHHSTLPPTSQSSLDSGLPNRTNSRHELNTAVNAVTQNHTRLHHSYDDGASYPRVSYDGTVRCLASAFRVLLELRTAGFKQAR